MAKDINTDIAVIGGGSGGLTLASGAVQMGAKVVLIEKGKMGGDCLNYGCIPSKALLAAGRNALAPNSEFGVSGLAPKVDFSRVNRHVKQIIASIAPHDSVERFTKLGVQVIKAKAQLESERSIMAGKQRVRAKYIVVATGSSPAIPPIPGLDEVPYLTNETIFDNKTCPKHLLIIGGGPIGLEMAQAHVRLGAQVSVMDLGPVLPRDDPQFVEIIRQQMTKEGVRFHEKISIVHIAKGKDGPTVTIKNSSGKNQKINGSHLLVATGRRANVGDLNLDAAGVRWNPRGIEVNKRLQTSNRRIYAIGDVASPYQFTHVAGYHAGIVIHNILFKMPAKTDYRALPWVTYTDPEMAHCGMTWDEATSQYREKTLRRLEFSYADNDRARTERATNGVLKVIVTKKGKILGADIVGASAGILIQPWCLAIQGNLKIGSMAGHIAPYPTLGELNKSIAGSFYKQALFENPGLKKLVSIFMSLTPR